MIFSLATLKISLPCMAQAAFYQKKTQICPEKCPRKLLAGEDIPRAAGTTSGPLRMSWTWGQLIPLPAKELEVVNGCIPPAQRLGAK